ncbi:hypothetical protein AB1N83_013472 [Pleurotus pulmonarius]
MMADLGMSWANATASSGLEWDATRHYKQRPCLRHLTLAFWRSITHGTMPPKNVTVSCSSVKALYDHGRVSEHGRLKARHLSYTRLGDLAARNTESYLHAHPHHLYPQML